MKNVIVITGASSGPHRVLQHARHYRPQCAASRRSQKVFISPHYFFPTDSGWKFNGPLETDEFENKMFARSGRLRLDGFSGSGADWLLSRSGDKSSARWSTQGDTRMDLNWKSSRSIV